jgi:hypothetical protein
LENGGKIPVGNPGPAWTKDGIKAQDEKSSKNVKNLTILCKNSQIPFSRKLKLYFAV